MGGRTGMRKDIVLLTAIGAALASLFLNVSFSPQLRSEEGKAIDEVMTLLFAVAASLFVLIEPDRATGYTGKAR